MHTGTSNAEPLLLEAKISSKVGSKWSHYLYFPNFKEKISWEKGKHEETYVCKSNLDNLKDFWSNEMVF